MPASTTELLRTAPLTAGDDELLLRLLSLPTAGPLETGAGGEVRLWEAQRAYAEAARELGFTVEWHGTADAEQLADEQVPAVVRWAVQGGEEFLSSQPSLVLRLGPRLPHSRTVMFNIHVDTVAGVQPVSLAEGRFHGRGAIDAKGPAVALLAGIRAALAAEPAIGRETGVLIQLVSGEEGGAMGVYGTRPLIERGYTGRLNIFCEPTGRRLLTRSTAAMTARVRVAGDDSIDDAPAAGHNATVLLGHVAGHLADALPQYANSGQVCVAGLQTGPLHNKVYGTGQLLLNLSYGSGADGVALEAAMRRELRLALAGFRHRFAGSELIGRTAADAEEITSLDWLKRGLPALDASDAWAERLLTEGAGLERWPADEAAFTCDAIWADGLPDSFTAVFGPGDLQRNNAHAEGEFADREELELFAGDIARLLIAFATTDPTSTT
ncbi:M20/M25/M40 family metallo-hydrolase [Streptomyces sp. ISL-43]|uniref:M20/M25/M40 family metallo-hydrolase n=1 Tax=Streptomyces sp. ISL-43 TaxID=2819183 RepID=UPI0027E5B1BF|nr:M20/M25/M40 family metallo-hydrolase [Streptomyces sp. ISL-43]